MALLVVVVGCDPAPTGPASGSGNATAPPATSMTAVASATSTSPNYQPLLGRWLRRDGGYILHLRQVDAATGRLDAEYLNPKSIHIARAEARQEAEKTVVFVELQDENYPGCTYRLTHLPATDQLYGVYYQAALQESFDVQFERQSPAR